MFEGIEPTMVRDAERWLYGHNYHHQGDFRVTFQNGGVVDLREVVADFAQLYHSALIGRVNAWQKLAEDAINANPNPPVIVRKSAFGETSQHPTDGGQVTQSALASQEGTRKI